MRTMFASTPQWSNVCPDTKLISLVSRLRLEGESVCYEDFNASFYNKILTREFLEKSLRYALKSQQNLFEKVRAQYQKGQDVHEMPLEMRFDIARYGMIKKISRIDSEIIEKNLNEVVSALDVLRDKEYFYNPTKLINALNTLDFCLQIASLPFAPSFLSMFNYINPYFFADFESVNFFLNSPEANMFTHFFRRQIRKAQFDIGALAVAVRGKSQLLSALTLAKAAKDELGIKVAAFGHFWNSVDFADPQNKNWFNFFDYILPADDILTLKNLSQFLNSQTKASKVNNLIYLSDDEIVFNPEIAAPEPFEKLDLSLIDTSAYFSPETILSVTIPESESELDELIKEIKYNSMNFNISYYNILNPSLTPAQLQAFSRALNLNDVHIFFNIRTRFFPEYTFEVLEDAYAQGLRMIAWHFNSFDNLPQTLEILNQSDIVGIWNALYIEFTSPKDVTRAIEFISENKAIIHSVKQTLNETAKSSAQKLFEVYENPLWMYLRFREYIFLYVCAYGVQKIANTRLGTNE